MISSIRVMQINADAKVIVNAAFKVHSALGPGLLEKVYEACLAHEIRKAGLEVQRQVNVPIIYDDLSFEEALRLDLLVSGNVIVEVKAVELVNKVWEAQVLSQLKLTKYPLTFLINFNVPLIKDGIRRFANKDLLNA
jgi:GxxExxY protein